MNFFRAHLFACLARHMQRVVQGTSVWFRFLKFGGKNDVINALFTAAVDISY